MPVSPTVSLRRPRAEDLPALYDFQCDPESCQMAMVIPRTREAFYAIWEPILADPASTARVVTLDGELVGAMGCFARDGLTYTGYLIARPYWGRGIAARALALLLTEVPIRPLHARAAASNLASIRVLERNGFIATGRGFSPGNERLLACEEVSFILA
jgi:RimJ/RimL family protein N-acetyltransferase